jgi:hypothetical protein
MKNAILSYLKSYGLKAIAGLSGWQTVLAKLAFDYCWKYVGPYFGSIVNKIKSWIAYQKLEKKHQTDVENAKKYEEALKGGDIDNATDDLLNGRK